MPNTSRPSRDCYLCRERRIKCDLTRPGCMRCARRHVLCAGYRDELDVLFRNETASTLESKANRDRCKKANASTSDGLEPHAEFAHRRCLITHSAMAVPRPLMYSSTTEVEELPLILDHFSFSPGWQRHDSSMSFLNRMVQRSAEDSAIISLCRAAARAYFSNRLQSAENRSRDVATYGKALAATNALLQDRKACSQDDTALASVWLLGLHEVIIGAPNSRKFRGPTTWATHSKGLISLLRLRVPGLRETRVGRDLFWLINKNIQMYCFVGEVECPRDTFAWIASMKSYLAEDEHHTFQSALLGYRASSLNFKLRQLLASQDDLECSTVNDMIWEVEKLEKDIITNLTCTAVGSSVNLVIINRFNYHRAILMHLRSSLWALLNDAAHTSGPQLDSRGRETQSKSCVDRVSTLADALLETIPILLDSGPPRTFAAPGQIEPSYSRPPKWHDAMSLLWPLRLILWFRLSSDNQKSAARAALRRIASEFHIMHAISP